MGLKLPSFLFLMSCDVYYASYLDASSTPSQDLKEKKTWKFKTHSKALQDG